MDAAAVDAANADTPAPGGPLLQVVAVLLSPVPDGSRSAPNEPAAAAQPTAVLASPWPPLPATPVARSPNPSSSLSSSSHQSFAASLLLSFLYRRYRRQTRAPVGMQSVKFEDCDGVQLEFSASDGQKLASIFNSLGFFLPKKCSVTKTAV